MGNVAKLPVINFEWIKDNSQFNEDFLKKYYEESDKGCFLEVDVQYLEKLHNFFFFFFFERVKIGKMEKLVANLNERTEYFIHIRKLKQALNHELIFKKVHRVTKFN